MTFSPGVVFALYKSLILSSDFLEFKKLDLILVRASTKITLVLNAFVNIVIDDIQHK